MVPRVYAAIRRSTVSTARPKNLLARPETAAPTYRGSNAKETSLPFLGDVKMRRAITPVLLAVAMLAASASNASAFGLFGHHFGGSCDTAPACGCEVAPSCGYDAAPACGCEVADSCCAPARKPGLLHRLFHKHDSCCDAAPACEPACGCEVAPVYEPACGIEVAPACGCEAPACGHGQKRGLLHRLFGHHHSGCDSCCDVAPVCEPACGCEVAAPSCGCEF